MIHAHLSCFHHKTRPVLKTWVQKETQLLKLLYLGHQDGKGLRFSAYILDLCDFLIYIFVLIMDWY